MSTTIAGLARSSGVGVETVRFYQRRGLLETPEKEGGIRRYGDDHVRRLRFIRSAQAAGFTLDQIAELLTLDSGLDHARAQALALSRIEALDARILELQRSRAVLAGLARDCAASAGPCAIIAAFEGEGGGEGGREVSE
ncbi:MAG: MerR family transcriptional regulator [Caulobacter sp.]|nr:MerR family transcriptional regulator [Caulobacter sp.]